MECMSLLTFYCISKTAQSEDITELCSNTSVFTEAVFTTEVSHTGMNLDLFLQTIKLSRTRNLVVPLYYSPHRQSIDRVRQIYFAVMLFVYLQRHRLL